MSNNPVHGSVYPFNKFSDQFLASAARTDYTPLPPVKDAKIPTCTGYYDEGRCPRCHCRNPQSALGYCVTCMEQDQIDHYPRHAHVTEEDLS